MSVLMFIRFEQPDIRGYSTDPQHRGELDVISWRHRFEQPDGGSRHEQATHENLIITRYLDESSPELMRRCWTAQPLGKATLRCYRSEHDGALEEYLRVEMEQVVIADYDVNGAAGDKPVETIALGYGSVRYTYLQRHSDPSAPGFSARHDLNTGEIE